MFSTIPWKKVVPPESPTLAYKFVRMSTTRIMMTWTEVSWTTLPRNGKFGMDGDDVFVWRLVGLLLVHFCGRCVLCRDLNRCCTVSLWRHEQTPLCGSSEEYSRPVKTFIKSSVKSMPARRAERKLRRCALRATGCYQRSSQRPSCVSKRTETRRSQSPSTYTACT